MNARDEFWEYLNTHTNIERTTVMQFWYRASNEAAARAAQLEAEREGAVSAYEYAIEENREQAEEIKALNAVLENLPYAGDMWKRIDALESERDAYANTIVEDTNAIIALRAQLEQAQAFIINVAGMSVDPYTPASPIVSDARRYIEGVTP